MKLPLPARIPILYLILIVLIAVGVVPLYFYATKMVARNRETLGSNEKLLQNSVTTTLAQSIGQREKDISSTLSSLAFSIKVTSSGNLSGKNVESADVSALLQNYIADPDSIVPYARLVNTENQSMRNVGTIEPDTFLERELERGLAAAHAGREYSGDPLSVGSGKQARTVMVVGKPVLSDDHVYLGSLELVIDLQYLVKQLQQVKNTQNLDTFVVDRSGRVVASPSPRYATGQDMNSNELVKNFVDQKGKVPVAVTMDYSVLEGKNHIPMLGTYFPVTGLGWAVVAQKTQEEAYIDITDMRRDAIRAALIAIAFSIFVGIWAARRLTTPLHVLTQSSRTIAGGDFTHRVRLKSRTEFGELAQTFNTMTDDLEQFVDDLKKAAEENRTLFLSSIQMLAGAVDEKDPYTRGHSDRVTRYSVLIATEMGLKEEDIENIRVSAQLHDVGKIGIEDRILKKPGALTPEEFEIMKTHTSKGAAILRPVEALRDMLPGIELHHESLDGRGYPHGLKGEQIPL
ncbi:MAG: metal dependent phosphohydrolase, partial [Candidatus Angelobacter sp.]|nr:metal dependent phosphohydrolase [Candidatus Angelobacter sp.]